MNYCVWVAYGLWRLGYRRILPRAVVNRVPVVECGEPLVMVRESLRLRLRDNSLMPIRLREGVAERLYAAAGLLPDGFGHQVGAAVDVTLANADGRALGMGTAVCGFSEHTPTHADGMFQSVRKRRRMLCRGYA